MKKRIYFIVFFVVIFSLRGMSESVDSQRLAWAWTKAEESGLEFLAAQIKRDAQGFWSHKAGHYTVRSNVSQGLTAQAARYTERMLEILPRVVGFPVVRNGQEFSLTIHKTRAGFKAVAGLDCASSAFHQILAGGRIADVHIRADEVDSTLLMQKVDLRVMQRESVRALLELGGGGREVSVFMREGCASFFESSDMHEKVPRRESNMAERAIRSRMLALQESVMDKNQLCPDLISAWFLPESAFIGMNSALNQALAQSFVDYLLSSAQRYRKLRSLLYIDKSSQLNTAKTLLGMEKSWRDHICRILSKTLYVQEIDIPVCSQPSREQSDINIGRWGRRPLVVVSPGGRI